MARRFVPGDTASMQDVEELRGAGAPDCRKPVFPQPLAARLPDARIGRGGAAGTLDEARVIADEARGEGAAPAAAPVAARAMYRAVVENDGIAGLERLFQDRIAPALDLGKVHELGVIGVEILAAGPFLRPQQLR